MGPGSSTSTAPLWAGGSAASGAAGASGRGAMATVEEGEVAHHGAAPPSRPHDEPQERAQHEQQPGAEGSTLLESPSPAAGAEEEAGEGGAEPDQAPLPAQAPPAWSARSMVVSMGTRTAAAAWGALRSATMMRTREPPAPAAATAAASDGAAAAHPPPAADAAAATSGDAHPSRGAWLRVLPLLRRTRTRHDDDDEGGGGGAASPRSPGSPAAAAGLLVRPSGRYSLSGVPGADGLVLPAPSGYLAAATAAAAAAGAAAATPGGRVPLPLGSIRRRLPSGVASSVPYPRASLDPQSLPSFSSVAPDLGGAGATPARALGGGSVLDHSGVGGAHFRPQLMASLRRPQLGGSAGAVLVGGEGLGAGTVARSGASQLGGCSEGGMAARLASARLQAGGEEEWARGLGGGAPAWLREGGSAGSRSGGGGLGVPVVAGSGRSFTAGGGVGGLRAPSLLGATLAPHAASRRLQPVLSVGDGLDSVGGAGEEGAEAGSAGRRGVAAAAAAARAVVDALGDAAGGAGSPGRGRDGDGGAEDDDDEEEEGIVGESGEESEEEEVRVGGERSVAGGPRATMRRGDARVMEQMLAGLVSMGNDEEEDGEEEDPCEEQLGAGGSAEREG